MAPIIFKCRACGRTVRVPERTRASKVQCPSCGAMLEVPGSSQVQGQGQGSSGRRIQVVCEDCSKSFSVPASERGQVVSCPSCGSWVRAGASRRSILYHEVPLPFRFSSSVRRWLRFLAGFTLIGGLVAAACILVFYGTTSSPAADGQVRHVINPAGVLAAFGAAIAAVLGTVVLMALYWILQNVTAIHYATTHRSGEEDQ